MRGVWRRGGSLLGGRTRDRRTQALSAGVRRRHDGVLSSVARRPWSSLPSAVGRRVLAGAFLVLLSAGRGSAQEEPRQWQRRVAPTRPPVTVFHATDAISLPTAETLARGEWQFEIAHRFLPAVSDGVDALWGLDGPANMRLGLGYAVNDHLLVTFARSNLMNNWDARAKLRAYAWESPSGEGAFSAFLLALQGGVGWNSEVPERKAGDRGNFQYYGQLILNGRLGSSIAVGVVPSVLYNVLLEREDPATDAYVGFYGQAYLTDHFSVLGEGNVGRRRGEAKYDSGSFGIELETGGHFFKIFLTNSVRLNPSQFLAGTDLAFRPGEWRLGFMITRLLRF